MRATDSTVSLGSPLLAAPHRTLFFTGLVSLLAASTWWGLHLLARSTGMPVFALALQPAPIWAHAYLMLFAVFPTMFFGFLFTVFPRWMNGPLVTRAEYIATAVALRDRHPALARRNVRGTGVAARWPAWRPARGLLFGMVALFRVLLAAPQVVSHAVVVLVGLCVQCVALAGFAYGLARVERFRAALRGARVVVGRPAAGVLRRVPPHGPVLLAGRHPGLRAVATHVDPRGSGGPGLPAAAARHGRRTRSAAVRRRRCFPADGLVRPALDVVAGARQSIAVDAVRGLCVAAVRAAAADAARRRLHADGRLGPRARTDPRTGHGILRRHAGRDGDARDDGAFRPAAAHGPHHARLFCCAATGRGESRAERSRYGAGCSAVVPARQRCPVARRRRCLGAVASAASTWRRASTESRADGRVLPCIAACAHRVRDPVDRTVRLARRPDAGGFTAGAVRCGSATRRTLSTPCC